MYYIGGVFAFMGNFYKSVSTLPVVLRCYSIPISVVSWSVPFIFALLCGGNALLGIIALAGIILVHLGTNLFDDIADYVREKYKIDKGLKTDFNFQKGKCAFLINGDFSLKQCLFICLMLFLTAIIIGCYFYSLWGTGILFVVLPVVVLCLLYPILGCLGLGEIIVAVIFSPLLYSGVFFAMTGSFSKDILILSISTGSLVVGILHNHMLLDYKYDTTNRKITLCRLSGSEHNALILLGIFSFIPYINLLFWVFSGKLGVWYLLPLITVPSAIALLNVMNKHIKNPDEQIEYNIFMGCAIRAEKMPEIQRNFLFKFLTAQNLLISFTIVLCLSIILDNVF